MANPRILCLDISGREPGSAFSARLMLTYNEGNDEYIMTGTGTVAGGPVSLTDADSPCGVPPEQKWTCEVPSATADSADYILRGGDEGKNTEEGSIPRGACGIRDPGCDLDD